MSEPSPISREVLRAELAELKLDLIERLVSRSEHTELEKRVHNTEQDIRIINEGRAARAHLGQDVVELKKNVESLTRRVYTAVAAVNAVVGAAVIAGNYYF